MTSAPVISALSDLKQFPIDALKINQSFVNKMTSNPEDAIIVSAIIGRSKSLKRRAIAEGVETPEQHAFLLPQKCDEDQGYYYGQPMLAEALVILLQKGVSVGKQCNKMMFGIGTLNNNSNSAA